MTTLYPLVFEPVYKDYLWGGERLRTVFGRGGIPSPCAESWEISDRPEGMSIVANGLMKGVSLGRLMREHGAAILGYECGRFPLLCKIIDARLRLSVQVHPNETTAPALGGEPKTEAWYVLAADEGAMVYAGLKKGVDEAALRRALAEGNVEKLMRSVQVRPGDVIFLPGGRPHAAGEGCLFYEVQQNSNTTYRLFDWNRVGPDGKPRELHVEQALRVLVWNDTEKARIQPPRSKGLKRSKTPEFRRLLKCRWFEMELLHARAATEVERTRLEAHIIFLESGKAAVRTANGEVEISAGTTVLLPAALGRYAIEPTEGPAKMLRIKAPPRPAAG